MADPIQLNRELQEQFQLTDKELLVVQLTLAGLNPRECAERISSGDFRHLVGDFTIAVRTVQLWLNKPKISGALISYGRARVRQVQQVTTQQIEWLLPQSRQRVLGMVPIALDTIEAVMTDRAGRSAGHQLKAALSVLELAGVVQNRSIVNTLQNEDERDLLGMSDEVYEGLRRQLFQRVILGGKGSVSIRSTADENSSPAEELAGLTFDPSDSIDDSGDLDF